MIAGQLTAELFPPLPSRLASLLTLFRLAIPDLHSYFEDEQVPYVEVTLSWLTTLLSREMWLGDVLRLWGVLGVWMGSERWLMGRRISRERGHV